MLCHLQPRALQKAFTDRRENSPPARDTREKTAPGRQPPRGRRLGLRRRPYERCKKHNPRLKEEIWVATLGNVFHMVSSTPLALCHLPGNSISQFAQVRPRRALGLPAAGRLTIERKSWLTSTILVSGSPAVGKVRGAWTQTWRQRPRRGPAKFYTVRLITPAHSLSGFPPLPSARLKLMRSQLLRRPGRRDMRLGPQPRPLHDYLLQRHRRPAAAAPARLGLPAAGAGAHALDQRHRPRAEQ